eukprot:Hpha_TRINITY_DN34509_c0_g1::TRINITY_DN34509_c0_g1_i1::g.96461::m.96461
MMRWQNKDHPDRARYLVESVRARVEDSAVGLWWDAEGKFWISREEGGLVYARGDERIVLSLTGFEPPFAGRSDFEENGSWTGTTAGGGALTLRLVFSYITGGSFLECCQETGGEGAARHGVASRSTVRFHNGTDEAVNAIIINPRLQSAPSSSLLHEHLGSLVRGYIVVKGDVRDPRPFWSGWTSGGHGALKLRPGHTVFVQFEGERYRATLRGDATIYEDSRAVFASACSAGSLSTVTYLLQHLPHLARDNWAPPLGRAAHEGHLDVVKVLVERGALIEDTCETAAAEGRVDVVRYLLQQGNEEARQHRARRSLCAAVSRGRMEVMEAVVEGAGAWVVNDASTEAPEALSCMCMSYSIWSGRKIGPLALAARHGHPEMLKALLAHGARPGIDALVGVVEAGDIELTRLLISKGVDPRGTNLVARAVYRGFEDIVSVLTEHGAGVTSRHCSCAPPPLEVAVEMQMLGAVRAIIKHGGGAAPGKSLHLACRLGHRGLVRILLEAGAKAGRGVMPHHILE